MRVASESSVSPTEINLTHTRMMNPYQPLTNTVAPTTASHDQQSPPDVGPSSSSSAVISDPDRGSPTAPVQTHPQTGVRGHTTHSLSRLLKDDDSITEGRVFDTWVSEDASRRCRRCHLFVCHIWIWTFVVAIIFFVSVLLQIESGRDMRDQIVEKEQNNVMADQIQLWSMILREPLEAGYELQNNLVRTFPQLLSSTPISTDVFNMTTLQTTPGWLSGFSEVATKHPQLRSFGMMAILNNNDTTNGTTPKNQIYIEYIKPVNSASLDAAGQVRIQMNTVDQQLLAFSPNKSLHPMNTNTNGFNQFFPSDVIYSDSSATIATYLGQSTTVISNHSFFDLTTTNTFHGFQQLLQSNQTIGYLASQPPTNFNDGLRMVAAANNLIQSSSTIGLLTFAGYSTTDLNQLLATFPIYSGDAFLISPQGSIIASTNGMAGSNLFTLGENWSDDLRDFLFDGGLIINSPGTTLAYQSGLRGQMIRGDYPNSASSYLAEMIPGLPGNSQLSLVVRLFYADLYDSHEQLVYWFVSLAVWLFGFMLMLTTVGIVIDWFGRLVITAIVIGDYYYYPGGNAEMVHRKCVCLLKLVHGWKLASHSNRPIPRRLEELIRVFIPPGTEWQFDRHRFDRWFDDLVLVNGLIERWLYEFVENECNKHLPPDIPLSPPPMEEEMKTMKFD